MSAPVDEVKQAEDSLAALVERLHSAEAEVEDLKVQVEDLRNQLVESIVLQAQE